MFDFINLTLQEFIRKFNCEDVCLSYLEERFWNNIPVSPFDPSSKVYNYGNHKYRCRNTGKNFNVKTNTLFHGTKVPLDKWFYAIWKIANSTNGISSVQLSKEIGIRQATAWSMLHRIRMCMSAENVAKMSGEVELDETYVGGKEKSKHSNKRIPHNQGRSTKTRTAVLGMLERNGKVVCRVIKGGVTQKKLAAPILTTIKRTATLYTDEYRGYNLVGKVYKREKVNHSKKLYVKGKAHTNGIEGFWSKVKRSFVGVYYKMSRKYLHLYMNEYVFRHNVVKENGLNRFNHFLTLANRHVSLKELVA